MRADAKFTGGQVRLKIHSPGQAACSVATAGSAAVIFFYDMSD